MKAACNTGWQKQSEKNSKVAMESKRQIEVILIKLWTMQRDEANTLEDFVDSMGDFSESQLRFLDSALSAIDWTREAISSAFRTAFLEKYGCPISPD